MLRLRVKQKCPLHPRMESCVCRGTSKAPTRLRQVKIGWVQVRIGVQRAPDGREKCSKAELARRKFKLLDEHPYCAACGNKFEAIWEAELAHRTGKGLGGGKEDSRMENLTLLHALANRHQGSIPLDIYLRDYWKDWHCKG